MTFDKFVGEVQHRARLGSLGDAVRAIRCTLGVLSQRLADGEAKDLASQLPGEIAYYLMHTQAGEGLDFKVDEFLDRISACECIDKAQSIHHVRTVLEVLRESVTAGQLAHIADQLPEEFRPLLAAGSEGKMRLKKTGGSRPAQARRRTAASLGGRRQAIRATAEESPRSARIAKRATGAWHLGR